MNKKLSLTIREEKPADYNAVENLIRRVFALAEYSDRNEHLLVKKIRNTDAFVSGLSMVAKIESLLVGHILITKIIIRNRESEFEPLALAPVSVFSAF